MSSEHRALVHVLIVLGLLGIVAELASTVFVPRLLLYLIVLAVGIGRLIRHRIRNRARRAGATVVRT